jgi:hypothetical protein
LEGENGKGRREDWGKGQIEKKMDLIDILVLFLLCLKYPV